MRPMKPAAFKSGIFNGAYVKFPIIASYKLDGVRAIVKDSVVLSNSLKPIPNKFVQRSFGYKALNGLDGELIVGDPTAFDCFRKTMSGVMSVSGEPYLTFYVFDNYLIRGGFEERYQKISLPDDPRIKLLNHVNINHSIALMRFEHDALTEGYEGVILRAPNGKYKYGRSTLKEGGMLKMKSFMDAEATIIGFKPLEKNFNEPTINELGLQVRSSNGAGKEAQDTLGALRVMDVTSGTEFWVGSGFTQAQRKAIWILKENYIGALITYKYQSIGTDKVPRLPIFKGFRNPLDMENTQNE